jgi:hypothetical protein
VTSCTAPNGNGKVIPLPAEFNRSNTSERADPLLVLVLVLLFGFVLLVFALLVFVFVLRRIALWAIASS